MCINAPLVFHKGNTVENTGKIMTSVSTGDKISAYIQGTECVFHSETLGIAPSFPNLLLLCCSLPCAVV